MEAGKEHWHGHAAVKDRMARQRAWEEGKTAYRRAAHRSEKQRRHDRDKRMRAGEELSSDEEGGLKGLGLQMIEVHAQKDTEEEEN